MKLCARRMRSFQVQSGVLADTLWNSLNEKPLLFNVHYLNGIWLDDVHKLAAGDVGHFD